MTEICPNPMQFLIYLNMSGEMVYILEERFKHAFGITNSTLILGEIVKNLFSKKNLQKFSNSNQIWCKEELKTFFEEIVRTNRMALKDKSMDKMFNLMLTGLKYQILMCKEPREVLQITFNHLNSIKEMFNKEYTNVLEIVEEAYELLVKSFENTWLWQWSYIRHEILNYVALHLHPIMLLIRDNKQLKNGKIILFPNSQIEIQMDSPVPGTVRYIVNEKDLPEFESTKFSVKETYELKTNRNTTLGLNIYIDQPQQVKEKASFMQSIIDENRLELKKLKISKKNYFHILKSTQKKAKLSLLPPQILGVIIESKKLILMPDEEIQNRMKKENEVKFLSHLLGKTDESAESTFVLDLFDSEEPDLQEKNLKNADVKDKKETKTTESRKGSIKKKSLSGAINEVLKDKIDSNIF